MARFMHGMARLLLAAWLAVAAAPLAVHAQVTDPGTPPGGSPDTAAAAHHDSTSGFGWIGIIGLAGLLGLFGGNRRAAASKREHDVMGGRSATVPPTPPA